MARQPLSVDQALMRANSLAEQGKLVQARKIYNDILDKLPGNKRAIAGLESLEPLKPGRQQIDPDQALREQHINDLIALYNARRLQEALDQGTALTEQYPDEPLIRNILGAVNADLGRLEEAVTSYADALRLKPDYAEVHSNLGNALLHLGKHEAAIDSYEKALEIKPDLADAHNNLGNALNTLGRHEQAIDSLQKAMQLMPDVAQVHNNFGNALLALHKYADAIASYSQALHLNPEFAEALSNRGNALKGLGKYDDAIASYSKAIQLKPDYAEAHFNLGLCLIGMSKHEEAIASLTQSVRLKPNYAEAYYNLGLALTVVGKHEEAAANYERSLEIRPSDRVRFADANVLPVIYQSMAEIEFYRNRFTEKMKRLLKDDVHINPIRESLPPPFYLAYQGKDNRELIEMVGQLGAQSSHDLSQSQTGSENSNRPIKIGFISTYFTNHTVGEVWRGMIAKLARDKFSVTVLSIADREDRITEFLKENSDQFIRLTGDRSNIRQTIADLNLDILYYIDIGMAPATYALAMSRLAPIQCVTWGHPLTSGLPTIDHYISSDLLEVDDADRYYTEELVRLKSLGIYYYRPDPPVSRKNRVDFGLPADANLYGCLQSLFKFHPNFDSILAAILRADPQAQLVIPAGQYAEWTDMLMQRFRSSLAGLSDRVIVIPRQSLDDFTRLTTLVDVLLVPPDFGGGKTSYDALSLGLPIVTMPSPMLAGRITYALYRKMGVFDCVAETPQQYVDIAVRIGTEPEFRAAIREKILAANDVLFEDIEAVRELEAFFSRAVADHRQANIGA